MLPENQIFSSGNGPLHPENIPAELKALPQWVGWRYEERAGKPTKTPYQVSGALAKVNDSATWTTFTAALAAYQAGGFSGIGIVLTEQDDLVGIDLDKVLNPDTGELDAEASRIVSDLPTYCEVSPSGRGLRMFGFGKLPQGGRRKGHVEMYEAGRYLTVTGNRFNGHATLAEITPELSEIHARIFGTGKAGAASKPVVAKTIPADPPDLDNTALLDKARRARNGSEFAALWSGDLSAHGGDHSAADLALCNLLAFWTGGDAGRIDRLFRQSGLVREKWDKPHFSNGRTYGQATIDAAIAGTREIYSGRKPALDTKIEPAPDATLDSDPGANPFRGTDDANADLLLKLHGNNIRYCPTWEKWLLWTGSHWRIDDRLDIERMAADVPRYIRRRAARIAQECSVIMKQVESMVNISPLPAEYRKLHDEQKRLVEKIKFLANLAGKLEYTSRRSAMLIAARHKVVVHHSDLDKGHYLLNASNGTVNLHTGAIRLHERADLLTHDVETPFDATATAPAWLAFLHSTFGGDADLIQFVQRAVGYSLTGDVREQVLLICYGSGSNGKSVFLNILRKLLCILAIQAAPDLLMQDKQKRHPTEQADLFGKRVVICQETGEGRRFNETLVKQLTGGDGIRARRMCEDFWEFNPTHKLWLSTNHKPEIRGTDHAIWRRIRLIPFNVQFTDTGEHRKDPEMEAKLTAELPGILAWAVQGCLDWQQQGLTPPVAVTDATSQYQSEMDVLAAWMRDCCVLKKHCEAKAASLYISYTSWCEQSGEHPEKQRKFGMRLKDRGFEQFTSNGACWRGIGLLTADGTNGTNGTGKGKISNSENFDSHEASFAKYGSVHSVTSVTSRNDGLLSHHQTVDFNKSPDETPQRQALAALETITAEQRANLQAAGHPDGKPRVRLTDWRKRLPAGTADGVIATLEAGGKILIDGLFVSAREVI